MKLIFACLLILALVVCSACAQPAEAPPDSTPPPTTTQKEEAEAPPPATITEEDVEAARQVVFAYLEAFNNYDVDGVLAFLEESWRQEREESITSEIGQMESFGVKLGVEEEAESVITPDEKVEIKIKLTTPIGAKHVTYQLVKIDGEWKICLAVEE